MPNFTYTRNIPNGPNNPSADQPIMQTNANSTDSILDIDLYGFNDNNGGTHQQVTLPLRNAAGAQTDPQCVIYSAAGTASTVSDLNFRNQNGIFFPNCIRAMGTCAGNLIGATPLLNGFNVSSISRVNGNSTITVTLTSGSVTGTNYAVIASCTRASAPSHAISLNYAIINATQFTIQTYNIDSGASVNGCDLVSFIVLQV